MPYKTGLRLLGVARNPANGFPARLLGAATRGWAISGLVGQRGALSGDGLETWLQVFDEELGLVPGEGPLVCGRLTIGHF